MRDYPNLDNLVQLHLTDLVERFNETPTYTRVEHAREALAILGELRDMGGWILGDLDPADEARLREAVAAKGGV